MTFRLRVISTALVMILVAIMLGRKGMTLRLWVALAALTMILDGIMLHRRFSGAMGERVQARYRHMARMVGGMPVLVVISAVADLFIWPLALAACAFVYVGDRRGRGR